MRAPQGKTDKWELQGGELVWPADTPMSQRQMGELLGCDQKTAHNIERRILYKLRRIIERRK